MSAECDAEAAGYDGMFGVYCTLPAGHTGPHKDSEIEWDFVDPKYRNQAVPVVSPERKETPA